MKSNFTDDDSDDFYQLLEVQRGATDAEIKKAYRRLALRCHPDKNPDQQDKAESRFKKIGEAYEVLSNKEKRLNYDRFGKAGLDKTTPNFNNPFHNFHFHDPRDIFTQVFGEDPFKNFHDHFHHHSSPFTDDFPSFFSRQSSRDSAYSSGNSGSESGSENGDDPFNHDKTFGGFSHHNLHENLWKNKGFNNNFNNGGFNTPPKKPGACKSTSIQTKYVDGKKVVTKTVKEGGTETITVEEDGFIIEQTVKTL